MLTPMRWHPTRRAGRANLRVLALVLLIATSAAACSGDDDGRAADRGHGTDAGNAAQSELPSLTFTRPATALESGSPGDVLSKEPIELAPELHGTGWKITYVSSTPAGDLVPVSGVLIQPLTAAPAGGYPVVVWAHGTTGIGDACAPSAGVPFDIVGAARLLDAGDVIAAPDYEGLGIPDEIHSYLVGSAEGHSALDAARAARTVGAGRVTVTWGGSQGGHASLFARQLQPRYAPELDFRGAAAQAPVTDLGTFLRFGATGPDAFPFAAQAIVAWTEVYDELDLADLVVGGDEEKVRRAQQGCTADFLEPSTRPFDEFSVSILQSSETWQEAVRINSVGVGETTSPVLLTHGDLDTTVPIGGTLALFDALCARDVPTELIRQPMGTHVTAWTGTIDDVAVWIADRIAGATPPSDCP